MFKLPAPTISTLKSRVVFMLLKAWIVTICVCLCSIILNNTIQESLRLILIHKSSHNSAPQLNFFIGVTTYPSAGGRCGTRGCVFQERNTRGVATNIYLRKTSEKPEKTRSTNFLVKGSGVVFTHGEGISTPRVRHKRR